MPGIDIGNLSVNHNKKYHSHECLGFKEL
ncbi:hypothetical protein JL09_g5607 [Pichia kudriavzevii]|uniref:Uncharacterized protein n=1 Tax=Pichia kudriavzevii TaxID=4909 RepID=A0A099NR25_PICKU|nr:hypothetical protein JL09_g5607 [Pichia kudriavzevii]